MNDKSETATPGKFTIGHVATITELALIGLKSLRENYAEFAKSVAMDGNVAVEHFRVLANETGPEALDHFITMLKFIVASRESKETKETKEGGKENG